MKLRSAIHLNGRSANLNLFATLNETADHLILKLAAYLFFFEWNPSIVTGATIPALQNQEYFPDVMSTDDGGQITLWVECGKTTAHKLEKISKRFREARVIVLTPQPLQAQGQAATVKDEELRVEVWTFAQGEYERWRQHVQDRNDIIGESSESALNLVINDQPYVTELQRLA